LAGVLPPRQTGKDTFTMTTGDDRFSRVREARRWLLPLLLTAVLALLLVGPLGVRDTGASGRAGSSVVALAQGATPAAATPVAATGCEAMAPGVGAEPWIRTELYFGTTMPDGSMIPETTWRAFLDEEITPRFPAGLTVLEGYGQYLNSKGVIAKETSIVLIIFYPADTAAESSALLEEIRDAYETQFDQESVRRADSQPVCISF
jgi:hypothetical protein